MAPLLQDVLIFIMFMMMGAGANWVAISVIAQETSIYIEDSPQFLCVGAFLTMSNNAGFLGVLLYFIIFRHVRPIPHVVSMPFVFLMGTTSIFIAAFAYDRVVDNLSLYLYIANFLAGAVGAVGSVILPQFLAYYQNHLITAGRAGGNAAIFITAAVAIAQSPGGAERFSARTYLVSFACLLLIPLLPFYAIVKYRIGERGASMLDKTGNNQTESPLDFNSSFSGKGSNPRKSALEMDNSVSLLDAESKLETLTVLLQQVEPSLPIQNSTLMLASRSHRLTMRDVVARTPVTEIIAEKFLMIFCPCVAKDDLIWMKKTLPYALAVGFADFCAFGIVNSAAPFSYSHTSESGGLLNLTISIQTGSFVLVFGDLLTAYLHIPLWIIVPTMFFCTMMFVLTAFGVIWIPPYGLIVFAAMINFMEAHTLTSTYRTIATQFPIEINQKAARMVGFLDAFLNTLGAIIGLAVVVSFSSC
jgi:hypothetical protein